MKIGYRFFLMVLCMFGQTYSYGYLRLPPTLLIIPQLVVRQHICTPPRMVRFQAPIDMAALAVTLERQQKLQSINSLTARQASILQERKAYLDQVDLLSVQVDDLNEKKAKSFSRSLQDERRKTLNLVSETMNKVRDLEQEYREIQKILDWHYGKRD